MAGHPQLHRQRRAAAGYPTDGADSAHRRGPAQSAPLQSALALGPPLAGDRFSVCAATIAILAAAAERSPTLIVVDDLHWLDAASKEAVLFAAHRLQADGIALLLATRRSDD